jgi:hypothetical protein
LQCRSNKDFRFDCPDWHGYARKAVQVLPDPTPPNWRTSPGGVDDAPEPRVSRHGGLILALRSVLLAPIRVLLAEPRQHLEWISGKIR